MKDFVGEPLAIGDAVATMIRGYSDLRLMYVYGFTKHKIKLSQNKILDENDYWNCTKFPQQVAKLRQ